MDWKDRTFSIEQLEGWANQDDVEREYKIMDWLRIMGIIPNDVVWTRGNALTKTSLDGEAIRAGYLAELAFEWDKDGESYPWEFVESLLFEINGHIRNDVVSEVLGELGR